MNANNIILANGKTLFADTLLIDASMIVAPIVTFAASDANLLDNRGAPIPATVATFINKGGGIFALPFYLLENTITTVTIDVNGEKMIGSSGECSPCPIATIINEPIPTMSEWGLLIFGLLILNLGVYLIYKKETAFS